MPRVVDLLRKDLPKVDCWIEPKILPKGGFMLFGGLPKIGKSLITHELQRALTTATRPFDSPLFWCPEQARVLLLEQEVGEESLKDRYDVCFARHKEHVYRDHAFYETKDFEIDLKTALGRAKLVTHIQTYRPNVLILDPISAFHSYDESDITGVAELLKGLTKLCKAFEEDGLSIILSHHFKKPPAQVYASSSYDYLDFNNFSGSRLWTGTADTIVALKRFGDAHDYKSWCLASRWTTRHGQQPPDMTFFVEPENREGQVRINSIDNATEPKKKLTLNKDGDL